MSLLFKLEIPFIILHIHLTPSFDTSFFFFSIALISEWQRRFVDNNESSQSSLCCYNYGTSHKTKCETFNMDEGKAEKTWIVISRLVVEWNSTLWSRWLQKLFSYEWSYVWNPTQNINSYTFFNPKRYKYETVFACEGKTSSYFEVSCHWEKLWRSQVFRSYVTIDNKRCCNWNVWGAYTCFAGLHEGKIIFIYLYVFYSQ